MRHKKQSRTWKNKSILIWVFAFGIVGVIALAFSHAATPVNNAFEPESGTITNGASGKQDTNASGGSYIAFAASAPTCPAGQTGTPPNCVTPTCPAGQTGTPPNCVTPTCPAGQVGTPPNCTTPSGTMIFDDEFDGTSVDKTKWDVYDRVSDQDNHELNCVIPANITVTGGLLNGIEKHEDHTCGDSNVAPFLNHYTSWQIGQKTAPFKYGTVQVRAKEPGGTGIWPTIFLLGNLWQPSQAATADVPGSNWPNGGWGEVDIAEFLNNSRTQVNNVAHVNMNGGTVLANLPFDATSRFMVYRLQWSANALVYSVDAEDGVGFRTLRTITDTNNIPQVPYYLTINAAVGGNGGGTPNPSTFPQTFQIDWVRITQ